RLEGRVRRILDVGRLGDVHDDGAGTHVSRGYEGGRLAREHQDDVRLGKRFQAVAEDRVASQIAEGGADPAQVTADDGDVEAFAYQRGGGRPAARAGGADDRDLRGPVEAQGRDRADHVVPGYRGGVRVAGRDHHVARHVADEATSGGCRGCGQ